MANKEHPDSQAPQDSELSLEVDGFIPPPNTCPIGWQPHALAPVFHGMRELGPADGAPVALRIFFPSIQQNPPAAAMLKGCGRYPLILFAHGSCHMDPANYTKWNHLLAQLARAGYVVVAPHLASTTSAIHPTVNEADLKTLGDVLVWARTVWEHRAAILPAPATGIIGHSYGAVLSARLATASQVAAYASLGGAHGDLEQRPFFIERIAAPRLVIYAGEEQFHLDEGVFDALASPKHRVIFTKGRHWDYVPSDTHLPCATGRGPCPFTPGATTDLVTMFFAKYLPPELNPSLPNSVHGSLVPPPNLVLTPEQQPYAGAYLDGFGQLSGPECEIDLYSSWQRMVPYVIASPPGPARNDVLAADLVPKFTGPGSDYVKTQNPAGGTIVYAGDTVKMYLVNGEVP